MITLLGIAGWCAVTAIITAIATLALVAHWDRKVDLRLIESLPPLPVDEDAEVSS